ncbi:VWA domain-containing protein [Caballeronia sp. LP006]|jgi:mxaC protein|uniref:vWA domain-containing protein n=1 Tax=unclassified Caballeronia TaxID=2646786 RepID=UPI002029019D|nr:MULTISPECIES: vWA domain-containing protein [unclassified Caballeronia]MDR5806106.1 VWA domain-containing protein [Caballeronia sp. LZ001]MDR5826557.1 VWA domain-containing protein [Caballeronia sp. LP006]
MPIDFLRPWLLLMLPLALLPLLPRPSEAFAFSSVNWLPADTVGATVEHLRRACAVLAMLAIIIGLAGPGRSHLHVLRTSTAADILILMDRSASMDSVMSKTPVSEPSGQSKNAVARHSLERFVAERPDDRFAFLMFGISPVLAVPFTSNHEIITQAISGTGIGRGMPDTKLDRGLIAAIKQFDGRQYAGRRAIVLVSDGGAHLDAAARAAISEGLARNQIALYFVYLRSGVYSPDLTKMAPADDASAEAELHRYFQTLGSPYRLYQAEDAGAMAAAMSEINKQHNAVVSFDERLPRQDESALCYAAALLGCAALLALRAVQVRSWS